MIIPTRGTRFLHARQIDGSPKAGTAKSVEMIVTAVRGTTVYYKRADSGIAKGTWCTDISNFANIVKPPREETSS